MMQVTRDVNVQVAVSNGTWPPGHSLGSWLTQADW